MSDIFFEETGSLETEKKADRLVLSQMCCVLFYNL